MKMEEMMRELVASGLIEQPQENVFPRPNPDNYVYDRAVTFYDMPEPPPLSRPWPKDEDASKDASKDASEDAPEDASEDAPDNA